MNSHVGFVGSTLRQKRDEGAAQLDQAKDPLICCKETAETLALKDIMINGTKHVPSNPDVAPQVYWHVSFVCRVLGF